MKEPSKAWVSDITYIQTKDGFLYLTIILDLFDREIIGWSLSNGLSTKQTTLSAWKMALKNRKIANELIFHSDREFNMPIKTFCNSSIPTIFFTAHASGDGGCVNLAWSSS